MRLLLSKVRDFKREEHLSIDLYESFLPSLMLLQNFSWSEHSLFSVIFWGSSFYLYWSLLWNFILKKSEMWGILKIFRTYFMFGVSSNKIIKNTEKRAFQFHTQNAIKKFSSKSLGEWLSHNFNTILYKAHGIIIPQNINFKKLFLGVSREILWGFFWYSLTPT